MKKLFKPGNAYGNNTGAYNISISPGTRFFFFKSLIEKAKHNSTAANILNNAYNIINFNGESSNTNETEFLAATQAGIELLYNMYKYEQANELKLFNEKIAPLLIGEYSEYLDCYTPEQVNYIKFMALLKKMENDEKIGLKFLKDMYNAMSNFDTAAQKVIEQKLLLNETQIRTNRRDITITGKNNAGKKQTLAHIGNLMASALDDYATRSNLSDSTKKAYDFLEQNIISMLLSNTKTKTFSSTELNALRSNLLEKLKEQATKVKEIQNEDGTVIEQIETNLSQLLEEINTDEKLREKIIKEEMNAAEQMTKYGNLLLTQGTQMERLINRINASFLTQKADRIFGFDKRIRQKIAKLFPNNKELQDFASQSTIKVLDEKGQEVVVQKFNILKKEHLKMYINSLKRALEMDETTPIVELIQKVESMLKTQKNRKEILTIETEYKSANFLSIILDAIYTNLDGWLNGKNDATLFTIGQALYETNDLTDAQLSTIKNELNQIFKKEEDNFNKRYHLLLQQEGKKNNDFNARLQLQAANETEKETLEEVEQMLNEHNSKLKSIQDIFQIDSSVKFAETFINSEGFHGGSLGSDVYEQIDNINFMLETGGITPIDADFLISAVINAGDGMIGSNQRPALENYFTTIASMLMFRTGGRLLEQWKTQAITGYPIGTTKIHIYTFNTIYVPESYILLMTYNALQKCVNLLNDTVQNTGSKAFIYNPVSEANKEQKTFYSNKNEVDVMIPDWQATSDSNYPKVKIEMALMGGFLDILNEIIQTMEAL